MKKRMGIIFFVSVFLLSLLDIVFIDTTNADFWDKQHAPEIAINKDGSISPKTGLLIKQGKVYTLTGDVDSFEIGIYCSDIVFDGAGHKINSTSYDFSGLKTNNVTNVTIKNVEVVSSYTAIYIYYSCECVIENVTSYRRIYLTDGSHNNIIKNSSIYSLTVGLGSANNNTITENNILHTIFVAGQHNKIFQNNLLFENLNEHVVSSDNYLDNGSIGNYWGGYNGTDNNGDGIGDTQVIINSRLSSGSHSCADSYPLMKPIEITTIPEFPSIIFVPMLLVFVPVGIIIRIGLKRRTNEEI